MYISYECIWATDTCFIPLLEFNRSLKGPLYVRVRGYNIYQVARCHWKKMLTFHLLSTVCVYTSASDIVCVGARYVNISNVFFLSGVAPNKNIEMSAVWVPIGWNTIKCTTPSISMHNIARKGNMRISMYYTWNAHNINIRTSISSDIHIKSNKVPFGTKWKHNSLHFYFWNIAWCFNSWSKYFKNTWTDIKIIAKFIGI